MRNYWLIVTNQYNWKTAVRHKTFGINRAPGRIKKLKRGDFYVVFITGTSCFSGHGKIAKSPFYNNKKVIWKDKSYPHRFGISTPKDNNKFLPGAVIKDELSFVKSKEKWPVHFRGGISRIPKKDFERIVKITKKYHYSIKDLQERSRTRNTKDIGNELHDRIEAIFKRMGFEIEASDYNTQGPDIIVSDESIKDKKVRIIIQCKKHEGEAQTYGSLESLADEYAYKVERMGAMVAIIVISGYKPSKKININDELNKKRVAIWTDTLIDYYEDLAGKIGSYAKYQLFSDLELDIKFGEDKEFNTIVLTQNNVRFYVFKASPEWLLRSAAVARRINFSSSPTGYQRLLSRDRIKNKIPRFLDEGEWVFPNTIIFASRHDTILRYENGKLRLPSKIGSVWIIDGQHRLYSFANIEDTKMRENSELLCTILDSSAMGSNVEARQASIFVTLNLQAKKVEKSLLFELYRLLGIKEPSVEVAMRISESKLFKGLVSGYSAHEGLITITTLVATIKNLTSPSGALIGGRLSNEEEISNFVFSKLLLFFRETAKIFKKEWGSKDYILSENRGVGALIRLYNKIVSRYDNKDIERHSSKILKILHKTSFNFKSSGLVGKYLGEGGPVQLADEWASLITREIPEFEPGVMEKNIQKYSSEYGDFQGVEKKLREWLATFDGDVRGILMHIDPTTLDYLKLVPKTCHLKIFFGNVDNEITVKEKLKDMREEGYKITLTKAQKPSKGSLFHERWLGSEVFRIQLNADLKTQAMQNSKYHMYLSEWSRAPEIIEFEQDWSQASKGIHFEFDWGNQ